jgi:hypothetical protein
VGQSGCARRLALTQCPFDIVPRDPLVAQHVHQGLDLSEAIARGALLAFVAGLLFEWPIAPPLLYRLR